MTTWFSGRYGGIYLDFDMILLKPLTNLMNTIGLEDLENGRLRPNGAIMAFEKSRFSLNFISEMGQSFFRLAEFRISELVGFLIWSSSRI